MHTSLKVTSEFVPTSPTPYEAAQDTSAAPDAVGRALRARPSTEGSTELTTVLFTDVVDSTPLALELGDDRWVELLYDHTTIVRAEVGKRDGIVVSSAGDGFVSIFPSASAGVGAAVAIIEKSRALGLDVRAGLHCGTCKRCGSRVGGILFHIAARVVALAAAGEVLVTHALRSSVVDPSLRFVERGAAELKGLPDPWEIFALRRQRTKASERRPSRIPGYHHRSGLPFTGYGPRLVVVGSESA